MKVFSANVFKCIILLLICALLCPVFTGCDSDSAGSTTTTTTTDKSSDNPENQAPKDPEPVVTLDKFADGIDFGGETINFAYFDSNQNDYYARAIIVDEQSTDSIDKAIYTRNQEIQRLLNVKITGEAPDSNNIMSYTADVRTSIFTRDGKYDIIHGNRSSTIELAHDSCLVRINDLGSTRYPDSNYIDLEAPYWDKSDIESYSYDGNIYWLSGDITVSRTSNMYCTFVNEKLYDAHIKSEYGDIHEIVRNKKWTADKISKMAQDIVALDSGYNGIIWSPYNSADAVISGLGYDLSSSSFTSFVDINLRTQQNIACIDGLKVMFSPQCSTKFDVVDSGENNLNVFAEGNSLFTFAPLSASQTIKQSAVGNDYIIVPLPTLNSGISNRYNTYISTTNRAGIFGISIYADNIAACAATLEAMSIINYLTVRPALIESFLPANASADDAETINTVISSVNVDFCATWGNSINGINKLFSSLTDGDNWETFIQSGLVRYDRDFESPLSELEDKFYKAIERDNKDPNEYIPFNDKQ